MGARHLPDDVCSGRVALTNGLGKQTGGGGHARSAAGGMDMVVEQVRGRDREIECELSGASGLASKTKNRAVQAQFSIWAMKIKGAGNMGVVGGGVHVVV